MRTIAHLSDLHFGRHDPAVAEGLIASLHEARPDLVVISGDLTQRGRRRQFAAARAFLDRLPHPILAVPGNHDIPVYDVVHRVLRRLARYRRYITAELQPSFHDDEIAVLGISTARVTAITNGRISFAQVDAIRAAFARVPAGHTRILVVHHPLMPPPGAPGIPIVGRAMMARAAIGAAGVHLVLAGHYHRAFSATLSAHPEAGRSILVVQAGTAVSTRRRSEPNSYNLLRVERAKVSCAVRVWQEGRFATGSAVDYALVGNCWQRR